GEACPLTWRDALARLRAISIEPTQVSPTGTAGGQRPTARCALGRKGVWMFDSLSEKLGGILDRLTKRGALSAADVDAALREVRRALLEADVALDVARSFVDKVRERAVGVEVLRSITPGQMVVKIVHDQ